MSISRSLHISMRDLQDFPKIPMKLMNIENEPLNLEPLVNVSSCMVQLIEHGVVGVTPLSNCLAYSVKWCNH